MNWTNQAFCRTRWPCVELLVVPFHSSAQSISIGIFVSQWRWVRQCSETVSSTWPTSTIQHCLWTQKGRSNFATTFNKSSLCINDDQTFRPHAYIHRIYVGWGRLDGYNDLRKQLWASNSYGMKRLSRQAISDGTSETDDALFINSFSLNLIAIVKCGLLSVCSLIKRAQNSPSNIVFVDNFPIVVRKRTIWMIKGKESIYICVRRHTIVAEETRDMNTSRNRTWKYIS